MKSAVLLVAALAAIVAGQWVTPSAYRDVGLNSEVFWHRSFIGLGAHPDWPFGNLAMTMDLYDYGSQKPTALPSQPDAYDITPLMSATFSTIHFGCTSA